MSETATVSRVAAIEIRIVDATVALVVELRDDLPPAVAVLSPREAHKLSGRLSKAANDASAAAARK